MSGEGELAVVGRQNRFCFDIQGGLSHLLRQGATPQRIEVLTTHYAHPLEFALGLLLAGVVLYAGLGLSPAAFAWFALPVLRVKRAMNRSMR